jgi:hypothetical protein
MVVLAQRLHLSGFDLRQRQVCAIAGIIHYYGAITSKLPAQYRNRLQHPALSDLLSARSSPWAWIYPCVKNQLLWRVVLGGTGGGHNKVAMLESLLSTTRHMQGRHTTSADVPNVQSWRVVWTQESWKTKLDWWHIYLNRGVPKCDVNRPNRLWKKSW